MNTSNHVADTVAACRILSGCMPEMEISPEVAVFLGEASAAEDDMSFSSGFQRLFNWHFYNNGNRIRLHPLVPGTPTSERRLERLLDRLERVLAHYAVNPARPIFRNLLQTAGRLMHHIQDMASPSHVVPVYHGPGRGDSYEKYAERYAGCLKPILGGGEAVSDPLLLPISVLEVEAAAARVAGELHAELRALYHRSAQETLDFIRTETIELTGTDGKYCYHLSGFWQERDDNSAEAGRKRRRGKSFLAGFGTYGILGNTFGSETLRIAGRTYSADKARYLEIHKNLTKKSILGSIAVLAFLLRGSGPFLKLAA